MTRLEVLNQSPDILYTSIRNTVIMQTGFSYSGKIIHESNNRKHDFAAANIRLNNLNEFFINLHPINSIILIRIFVSISYCRFKF